MSKNTFNVLHEWYLPIKSNSLWKFLEDHHKEEHFNFDDLDDSSQEYYIIYDHILVGYYNNNNSIRAIDILTGKDFNLEGKAHIKSKVEKCLNDNNLLGIYKKGPKNSGYNTLDPSLFIYKIHKWIIDIFIRGSLSDQIPYEYFDFVNTLPEAKLFEDSIKNLDPDILEGLCHLRKFTNINYWGSDTFISQHNPYALTTFASVEKYDELIGYNNKSQTMSEKTNSNQSLSNPVWFTSSPPKDFIINSLTWKFISRNMAKNKNTMLIGPSGCGKTDVIRRSAQALGRPEFYFNLGSTQDPRVSLIGSTQLDTSKGTFFNQSPFVTALQTENAVIILDELSRANPEAWNILMPVLDPNLRLLKLDETPESPEIKVHPSVVFMATANTGVAYTSARVMDRALMDRFVLIEMNPLNKEGLRTLLSIKAPKIKPKYHDIISSISDNICKEASKDDGKLSEYISTRTVLEMAELIEDGFNLLEAATLVIYPLFEDSGDSSSERTFVKQTVQKYAGTALEEDPLIRKVDMDNLPDIEDALPSKSFGAQDRNINDILDEYLSHKSGNSKMSKPGQISGIPGALPPDNSSFSAEEFEKLLDGIISSQSTTYEV